MKKCSEPAVSVIIPVYNSASRLQRCLDSVLRQRFADYEVILVDDGSTDGSGKICDEAAAADGRVKVIHQENRGPGAARNAGMAVAAARWRCFVDSDDVVEDDYISSLLSAEPKEGDLVITGLLNGYPDGRPSTVNYSFKKSERASDPTGLITKYNLLCVGFPIAKLFDRKLIEAEGLAFDTDIFFHEDHIFCLQYLLRCNGVCLVEGTPYTYIQNEEGTSLTTVKRHTDLYLNGAVPLHRLLEEARAKFPKMGKRSFRLTLSYFGLQDFVDAWKAAENRQEKALAARAIRERWFSFIKYYRYPRNKEDRQLALRIIFGIA